MMMSSTTSAAPELLALGECMLELHGAESLGQLPSSMTLSCGGDTLNALVAAARLGTRTGFITRVGDDAFADGLLQRWQAEGVDTRHARRMPGENGVYFIAQLPGGEREFSYRRACSAASQLAPEDVPDSVFVGARALLLSGITQALSPSAQAATLQAAQAAGRQGLLVAFDPNYRPALWAQRGGLAAARAAVQALLPWVDWLLPSDPADSELLAGLPLDTDLALKCGAQGVRLKLGQRELSVPAEPVAQVVDSTGAGDAWNGAFLHGLLSGATPELAARLANHVAGQSLAYRGALPPAPHPISSTVNAPLAPSFA